MNTKKRKNLSSFVQPLIVFIQIRIAFAFCCSHLYREQDQLSYFTNLIRIRVKEFFRARGFYPERLKPLYSKRLPHLVSKYKNGIQHSGLLFIYGKRGKKS